ncbi:MAG: hypothetical protein IT426_18835 [Pirellulales bacterium]|nr:hypothetical protein [Pirellulales bacterium]
MRFTKILLVLVLFGLPLILGASAAQGAFVVGFTGNTFPSNVGPTVDGHVNFAVLDTVGGAPGDTWGTGIPGFDALFAAGIGSGPLDTTAAYVYLFQTVNDGVNVSAISQNTVSAPNPLVTSHGVFPTTGFTPMPSAPPGDPSPALIAPVAILAGLGTITPNFQISGSGSQVATFLLPNLAAGASSCLWGYTVNAAPDWGVTSIQDGGTNASGTVPTPVPEPFAFAIWALLGLGGTGVALVRRRQANARTPWSEETRASILKIVERKR